MLFLMHNIIFVDIDECAEGTHTCDKNANCTDSIGSYNCMCDSGFSGDGHICIGEFSSLTQNEIYRHDQLAITYIFDS